MIFSRGRGRGGRHEKAGEDRGSEDRQSPDGGGSDGADEPAVRTGAGPYDSTEAPTGVERLDLGSLEIPSIEGVEIRVQADPNGSVGQVVLVNGASALQLGVFAAPRSAGIWDEVREEIRASLSNDGVKADELDGEFGIELRARVRSPEGPTDVRFIGVDGPRWMLRAVYQGPAAVDPAAAGPLADCLHDLVVNRGKEAMPVREALPLRLPREMAEQNQANQEAAARGDDAGQAAPSPNGGSAPTGQRRSSPRSRGSQ